MPVVVHELGHEFVSRKENVDLRWKFAFGKYYLPRYVYEFNCSDPDKRKNIKRAGFKYEILAAVIVAVLGFLFLGNFPWVIFPIGFVAMTIVHRVSYPYLNSNSTYNDFSD